MTAGRGQEYRNDSRRYSGWQGARVIESSGRLDTDWIQAGYRSRTGSRSRRGRGAGRGVLKNQETVAGARQGSTIDCGEGAA